MFQSPAPIPALLSVANHNLTLYVYTYVQLLSVAASFVPCAYSFLL